MENLDYELDLDFEGDFGDFDDEELEYDPVYDPDEDLDDDDDPDYDFFPDLDDDESVEFFGRRGRKRRRNRRRRRLQRRLHRMGGRSRPKTGSGKGYVDQKIKGLATKNEVKKGFKRVSADVRKNARAIKINSRRISDNSSVNDSQSRAIRKMQKDAEKQKQMQLWMALLGSGPDKIKFEEDLKDGQGGVVIANGTEISISDASDTSTKLLPFLMMGGLGSGGSDMNSLLPILLLADK